MRSHFGFSESQMSLLAKKKVTEIDLFNFANEYDIGKGRCPVGFMNLLIYIDKKGNFDEKPFFKTKYICQQIFENLGIVQKIEIHEYMADLDDGLF